MFAGFHLSYLIVENPIIKTNAATFLVHIITLFCFLGIFDYIRLVIYYVVALLCNLAICQLNI